MTIEPKVYEGDVGTVLLIDTKENISTASGLSLLVRRPDKSEVIWTPILDGTTKLKYTTVAGDVPEGITGTYLIQPRLTLSGWTGRGTTAKLPVYQKFS